MTIWTKCAYAWNHRTITIRKATYAHRFKRGRKMRTWLWLVGLKKVSKPSKGMTPCPLTRTCLGKMPALSSVRRTTSLTYLHLVEARFCSDLALLWYGRFSLRERFIKSRSWRPLYATCVRLDDQCVWARAIDVSWTPRLKPAAVSCWCARRPPLHHLKHWSRHGRHAHRRRRAFGAALNYVKR